MTRHLTAQVTLSVPFHDVDPAGVVWHGNYFRYFELARCELLGKLNYSYQQMKASGYIWPVVDLSARFTRPITFEQEISVVAQLLEWEYRLKIGYQLLDTQDQPLGRGETVQVPVSLDDGEMVIGSPAVLLNAVETAMATNDG